jgi:hypothetical protein
MKYGIYATHKVFVEPPEVEGRTPVFELSSPDGEKWAARVEKSGDRRY